MKKAKILMMISIFAAMTLVSCSFSGCAPTSSLSSSASSSSSQAQTFTAWFDLNGYTAGDAPNAEVKETGSLLTEKDISRTGYSLTGWSLSANGSTGLVDFGTFHITSNITLYAQWVLDTYTVSFDLNGGTGISAPASQSVHYLDYEAAGLTNHLTKPNMTGATNGSLSLNGWWLKDNSGNFTQEWNFDSDLPNKDITLYAGWGEGNSTYGNYTYFEYPTAIKITKYASAEYVDSALSIISTINGKPVLSIGESAFANYANSSNIILPSTLTTIQSSAFYNCEAVYQLSIPDSVTSIGKMAFDGCDTLYTLHIGSGVTNIGEKAFYQCSNLACLANETVTIPSSVISIEKDAFSIAMTNHPLQKVDFSEGLVYIGPNAFCYGSFILLELPDTLEYIGREAFDYCRDLAEIHIGQGIKYICYDAFRYTNSNTPGYLHVYVDAIIPPTLESGVTFGPYANTGTDHRASFWIIVPENSVDAYKADANWGTYYKDRIVSFIFS